MTFVLNTFKRITNLIAAFVVVTASVTAALPFVGSEGAFAATVVNSSVANLAADVAAAAPGDIIDIQNSGTLSSQVIINKPLTLTSSTGATVTVAEGVNALGIQANDVTIQNLHFVGPYDFGEGAVTRALEVSSFTNLLVQNNTFSHLRQPAYINDNVTGTIRNNYTDNTKGWVVLSNTDLAFSDNTWGENVIDVAIIAGATNNYTDAEVVGISDANNDAVVENQFGPTKRLSDSYVQTAVTGRTGDEGSKWNPYVNSVQSGLNRIVEGGTVHVANGSYSEALQVKANGTKLVGQSKAGVQITSSGTTPTGHAVSVEGIDDVTISDISFFIGTTGNPGYALKAYNTANLTLNNLDFTGRGNSYTPRTGGVDLNGVNGATITNVTAQNFSKNGFAVSSKYYSTDYQTQNITFTNISSTNNAWAGIAFYTTNSAGTVGGSMNGIVFSGTTTVANNPKGIEIVGDTDANVALLATPAYSIGDINGDAVNLGNAVFTGNLVNVINYQTNDLLATDASFDGKKGSDMTDTERTALAATIVDQNDYPFLGEVIFYVAPIIIPSTGGSDGSTTTTTVATTTTTPSITNPASVLGADSDTDQQGETDVEGTTDDKSKTDTKASDGTIAGLAWYWWLLIVLGLGGIAWWLIAAYRRRSDEQ